MMIMSSLRRKTECAPAGPSTATGAVHLARGQHRRTDHRAASAPTPNALSIPAPTSISIAHLSCGHQCHLSPPTRPNPHRARRIPAQSPAGSFPGGFRTTAPVQAAQSRWGRHPKPFTKSDISAQQRSGPLAAGRMREATRFESSGSLRGCDYTRDIRVPAFVSSIGPVLPLFVLRAIP